MVMAGRRGSRCNGTDAVAGCAARERDGVQPAADEMPMCRHGNPISASAGCCSVERQLWELNQVLDYQNKILVELLQAVRGRSGGA